MATNKKCEGTVKWFSNRKGFGFIAPTSDNSPTQEDIFVHQTSIVTDGEYRTLQENATVEFEVVTEEDSGKFKAVNVTGVGGVPIVPPARESRRRRGGANKKESNGENGDHDDENKEENGHDDGGTTKKPGRRNRGRRNKSEGDDQKEQKPRDPPFHSIFSDEVKKQIADEKHVELGRKSTVDVALLAAGSRIKLGQGGYAAFADAKGIVGEGTYTCDESAKVTFEWERAIEFADGEWKPMSDAGQLIKELSLTQDDIGPVKEDETPETLWGADKTDPKEAIQTNGFKMRRVALTRPRGGGGRRRGPPRAKKETQQQQQEE